MALCGLSLVVVNGGYCGLLIVGASLVVVCGLLMRWLLVAEHGLYSVPASIVLAPGL